MCRKNLIWISLFALCGNATANPVDRAALSQYPENPVNVSTSRSDGAIFPVVTQTKRLQQRRRVRVSGSLAALPALMPRSAQEEPAGGGRYVTPASAIQELDDERPIAHVILPFGPTRTLTRPKQKR